ncbi:hypothetical protein [Methylomonas sp. YC3]
MNIRAVLLLTAVLVCGGAAADNSEINQAMHQYATALGAYNTRLMTDLMHPEALSTFRNTFDAALKGPKSSQAERELLPLFGVSTMNDYRRLTNKEAYQRLNDVIARGQPNLVQMMRSSRLDILDTSLKGDVAYVVYSLKVSIQGRDVSKDVVQKLKKHDGKWMLLLPPTAEATIEGIHAEFQ